MKLILSLLFFVAAPGFQTITPRVTKWVITNGCWLKVDGRTNVNNFSCAIPDYSKPDTLFVSRTNGGTVQLNGNMQLGVQFFDCHNPVMTADLRKTLKAKEFPKLIIRFVSINEYPEPGTKQDVIKGQVIIELAGVSKRYEVDYKVVVSENLFINLVGSRKVNFSDFNIEPPRKLGGMIRTDNELSVVFNLRVKVIE